MPMAWGLSQDRNDPDPFGTIFFKPGADVTAQTQDNRYLRCGGQ